MDSITIPVDGTDVAVPVDAIRSALPEGVGFYGGAFGDPDGYLSQEALADRLKRHEASVIKKGGYLKPDEAYSADRLRQHFAAKGVELDEDGLPLAKQDPKAIAAARSAWEAEALSPLVDERDALQGTVASLQRQIVSSDAKAALLPEMAPEAFKPAVPGVPSPVESLLASGVHFDEEGKPYFQIGEGMVEYDVPKGILAYVAKHNKEMLADKGQKGAGPGGSFGGGGDRKETLEQRAKRLRDEQRR